MARCPSPTIINHSGDKTMKYLFGKTRSAPSKRCLVLLLNLLFCAVAQQPVSSHDLTARPHDNARPCGFSPCRQNEPPIEPQAGQWKTWVLSTGNQLQVPPPPNRHNTKEEIGLLKRLSSERDTA